MREPVLFPDAGQVIANHLNDTLGIPTGEMVPNPRPSGGFLVVRRVGGLSQEVVIDKATVVVEAWSDTNAEAEDLAQLARAYILSMSNDYVDDALVYGVIEVAAPAFLPDPLSAQPRSTATYQVTLRGAALTGAS
jgi:hypothetical protein